MNGVDALIKVIPGSSLTPQPHEGTGGGGPSMRKQALARTESACALILDFRTSEL